MLSCLVPRGGQAGGRGVTALQMRLEATFEITLSVFDTPDNIPILIQPCPPLRA